ncbi:MAG TPA: hypothetical protein ENJ57_05625, partial [Rhizobiales bacterium]|nr:hypothetical protein [Hyphomicrobiales bacterium]
MQTHLRIGSHTGVNICDEQELHRALYGPGNKNPCLGDANMKSIMKTLLVASLLFLPGSAFAGSGLIAKPSPHSVQETLDRFETVLKKKGITVFARIDHA